MEEIKRNIPRDLFLHLLAIVTLYWSAVTFVALLWQLINKVFPDVLTDMYSSYYRLSFVRFLVSSLIIVFPVFILVSKYLNKIYARESVVRESKIRKWLIYLTLFVAALVIIGDLVSIINTLMGGEPTLRFILKALSVLLVAGFIFGYYLDDVRRENPSKLSKYFAWGAGILVLAAIVCGFYTVGSPAKARLAQFDMQKINDLQNIEYQINDYYNVHNKLPNKLTDINNIAKDPQSGSSYEYMVQGSKNFQLCANFNFSTQTETRAEPVSVYAHGSGRNCFDRAVNNLFKGV